MSNPNLHRKFQNNRQEESHRVNFHIKVPQVRVIKGEEQLGVMPTEQARKMAMDEGLDLVEIVPNSRPPVCKIMDYGRFKYEHKIKLKEAAKRQRETQVELKEIRLRPSIADHDADVKIGQAKKFLSEGCRVQFNLQFKGHREMSHKERGFQVIQKVVSALDSCASVDKQPSMEGNRIICIFSPK